MPHEWSTLHGNLIVDNSSALVDGSGGHHQNVRWTYVHMGGSVIIDPHIGFYRNPPSGAKCRWSTNYGEHEPHHFNKKMLTMPSRELYLWNDSKLKTVADMYKQRFWQDLKSLTRPNTFVDLYEYFDAATLWYAGAYNLWNLMNMLVTEAHQRWPSVLAHWKEEIDKWVHGLLYEWNGFEHNQNALRQWDNRSDPLVDVRFNEMFNVGFDEMGPQETAILRDSLINQFYFLTGRVPYVGPTTYPHYPRPFDNITTLPVRSATASSDTSSSKAIVIVSSDNRSTSKPPSPELANSNEDNQPPQQPSPPASLASIPEEASADVEPIRPAKQNETTKDVVTEITIDKVATEAELAQNDSSFRDRKDSNGSTDALFLSLSPSRREVSGRHLSVQSAPDEQSEPMLGTATHSSPAKPHHQQRISAKSPSPSSKLRGKGKQGLPGPWRLQHKSPPRNNPCPPYHPTTGATPPHNMHTNPPSHMPSGLPNNLPPHPGMMSSPSGTPRHPYLNGFVPFGPPPPPGAGMGTVMGPAMPFHNQLPMQRPLVGHQNFSQGMPAPPMGLSNGNSPFQQPGVHQEYQPRQNSNKAGVPGGQKSNRRNSNVSNGSRKVRDDPVHGAIYSLRDPGPRKNSNSSSSRRPSFANVNVKCSNADLQSGDFSQLFNQTFRECACPTCDEATRSVYVKHLNKNLQVAQVREILFMYLGYLNPLAVLPKRACQGALVVFRHDSDAIRAVNDFQNNPDKSIRGLARCADIWYPIFSKHYSVHESFKHGPVPFVESHNNQDSSTRRLSQSKLPQRGLWRNAPAYHTPEQSAIPQQFPVTNGPMVLMPPTTPQRKLWEPTANPRKGSLEPTFPSKTEKRRLQAKSISPHKEETRADEILTKEDWRSKPPSEEAMEGDEEDEAAAADTVSTHSSQGSQSIVVCLPSPQKDNKHTYSEDGTGESIQDEVVATSDVQPEAQVDVGIASSRTMSPEVCGVEPPTTAPAAVVSLAVEVIADQRPVIDKQTSTEDSSLPTKNSSEVHTFSKASGKTHQKKNKHKRAPTDEKPTPNPTELSDGFAPEAPARGYRKTTTDLSSAVTAVWLPNDSGTVVRHKKPRAPLPSAWLTETPKDEPEPSSSRTKAASTVSNSERLLEISKLFREKEQTEGTLKMMDAAMKHLGISVEEEEEGNCVEELRQEPRQPPKKKAKFKKVGKAQSSEAQQPRVPSPSPSPSQHSILTGASSRGPSPAMQSHDDFAGPQKVKHKSMHKMNNKRYKTNRKMLHTASELSEGLAKSGGSQDTQNHDASSGGSPAKKIKDEKQGGEPVKHPMPSKALGPDVAAKGKINDDSSANKSSKENYRANNGGSLRMKKNRSPEKGKIADASQERDSPSKRGASTMPTIFEPPSTEPKNTSPDASLFWDQKTSVKDSKKQKATPKTQSGVKDTNVGSKLTPRSWSGVLKNEDPFTAGEGSTATTKDWIKDNTARSPKKSINESSPTPSPEKKAGHNHTKSKTKLPATAPLFVSSRPTSPVPSKAKLNPSVQSFATISLPPSPAHSVVAANDKTESGTFAEKTTLDKPSAAIQSAAPILNKKENITHHVKKPSLPGQSTGVDKRFITPADQIADPKKLAQPGAPAREKKTTAPAGSGSSQVMDQNPNNMPVKNPRWIPLVEATEDKPEQAPSPPRTAAEAAALAPAVLKDVPSAKKHEAANDKKSKGNATSNNNSNGKKKTTAAEVAAAESAPSMNNDNFPTLDEAAATESEGKKKRAASIMKHATPSTTSPRATPAPPRSAVSPATTVSREKKPLTSSEQVGAKSAKPDETMNKNNNNNQKPNDEDGEWRVVSSSKKTTANTRAPSGRGGRGGSWRGGRFSRSFSGPSDERKSG